MQFLHPWMLMGLLLVPAAVLLHVFRAPGRRHEVSTLDLWRNVLQHLRPESTERLKRFDWLLLLEVLVIALLVGALAWPVVWKERPHRSIRIIYDISASMKTVDADGKPRWDKAQEAMTPVLRAMSRGDEWYDYYGPYDGSRTRRSHPSSLSQDFTAPSDLALDPEKLLADGLAALGSAAQVVFLVTDKPPAKIDDPRVRVVAVGGPSRNAGIVAFADTPASDGTHEIFLRISNYAAVAANRKIVLTNDAKPLASEEMQIPPGSSAEKVFTVRLAATDPVLRVKLEGPDDGFRADDEVAAVLRPLMVVATGEKISPAYARLFGGAVFDGTVYLEATAAQSASVPADALVIAEGAIPQGFGALTVVVNPPAGEVAGIKVGQPLSIEQTVSPIAAGDPDTSGLLAGVRLSEIHFGFCRALKLSGSARPLMRVGGETVAAVADAGGSKVVVLGFDPTRAGWTLKPSFVVFWANVLAEAKKASAAGGLVFYRTGDTIRLPVGTEKMELRGPAGAVDILPDKDGWGSLLAAKVGVYEWSASGRKQFVAVNLLSEIESGNRPSPLVGKPPSFDLPAPVSRGKNIPLAPWLCLAAGVLAVVWWHYRR